MKLEFKKKLVSTANWKASVENYSTSWAHLEQKWQQIYTSLVRVCIMDVLTSLSVIFQLHRGGKFDGWNPSTCRQPLNCCIENTMTRVGIILSIFVDCGYNLSQVYWRRNQSTQEKTNQRASSNWKLYNIVVLIRPHDRQISNSQHLQWWAQMPIQLHDLYSNNPDVGSWPMPISSVKFSKIVGQCVLFVWAFLLQKSWYSWIYSCAIYTCIKSHNSQKGNTLYSQIFHGIKLHKLQKWKLWKLYTGTICW